MPSESLIDVGLFTFMVPFALWGMFNAAEGLYNALDHFLEERERRKRERKKVKDMEPEKTKQLQQMANCAVKFVSLVNAYNHSGLNYHLDRMNELASQLACLLDEFNKELNR